MKHTFVATAVILAMVMTVSCVRQTVYEQEPVTVKVMKVTYSEETSTESFTGTVEPSKSSSITAPYPGTLIKVKARKGMKVRKGDILAEIESRSVQSAYETAQATFLQAKDGLERVEQVYGTGSVTEAKLIEVRTSYAKAEAAFNAASKALENCSVKAPYNGVIGKSFVEEGIELSALEPMFQILDVNTVEIHASIPENEYADYSIGAAARVDVDAAHLSVDALLTGKGVEASRLSHSYDFTFRLTGDAAGIMPGMICKVRITSGNARQLLIPASAVRIDAEGRYVWCVAEGTAVKKHIVAQGFRGDGIIVEEGLEEGDLVVIEGGRKISSGMTGFKTIEQ